MPSSKFEILLEEFQNSDSVEEAINAVDALKELANSGDVDACFEVAEIYEYYYEDLGLENSDLDISIEYYSKAADKGHKQSLKELGIIFSGEEKNNPNKSIEYLLLSENYSKEIDLLLRLIQKFSQKVDTNSNEELNKAIKRLNYFLCLIKDKRIFTAMVNQRNKFFKILAKRKVENASNLSELEQAHLFFERFEKKEYLDDVKSLYIQKKKNLIITSLVNVEDAHKKLELESDSEVRIAIIKWIAESYRYGENGASIDIVKAIRAYEMAGDVFESEIDSFISKLCYEFLEKNDFNFIEKYYGFIKSLTNRNYFEKEIKKHSEKIIFESIKDKALSGDTSYYEKVGKCYYDGYGVPYSRLDALEWYEKAYKANHSKESFDFIFEHCDYRFDDDKFGTFLKNAKAHSIQFNPSQQYAYDRIFRKYAADRYDFVNTYGLTKIDIDENNIYYFYDYCKKEIVDRYPNNKVYRKNYNSFMKLKNVRKYEDIFGFSLSFAGCVTNILKLFSGNWYICSAPGHEMTKNTFNPVFAVINGSSTVPSNFSIRNTIIQRKYTVDKKATSSAGRNNDYKIDMKSLKIEEGFVPTGKSFIIFDDITTSGSTLIACKNILMEAGAKHVVCIAFGHTKDFYEH